MTSQYPPPPSRDPPPPLPDRPLRQRTKGKPPAVPSLSKDGDNLVDSIKAKLPYDFDGEGDEEGLDVVGYWAVAAGCW